MIYCKIFKQIYCILILVSFLFCQNHRAVSTGPVTITAVGDVRLSNRLINRYGMHISRLQTLSPFSGDIVFANFEGVLSKEHRDSNTDNYILTMPLQSLPILKKFKFTTLSLVNNHALDKGLHEFNYSKKILEDHGFTTISTTPTSIRVKNRIITFIAFSFACKNNVNDIKSAIQKISSCKGDIIIVSAHMGTEGFKAYLIKGGMEYFGKEKRGDVKAFARAAIDAGANLILGHGPHVPRGLALYKKRLIVYSMGNFLFDYPGSEHPGTFSTFAIKIVLNKNGEFKKATIMNYILKHGVPYVDPHNQAFQFLKNLTKKNLKEKRLYFKNNRIFPVNVNR